MGKLQSKLAIKIGFSFSVVLIIMSTIIGYIFYNGITQSIEGMFKNELINNAKSAALLIDIEKHEVLREKSDMDLSQYKTLRSQLQKLQNEINVKCIYTIRKEADTGYFVLDTDDEDPVDIGYEYEILPAMNKAFDGKAASDEGFTTDEWGTTLSAYAPLKDANNRIVGIVGIDIDAKDIVNIRKVVLFLVLGIFGVFIMVVIISSLIITRKITKPIKTVAEMMEKTADRGGDLTQRIKVSTNDEIGVLTKSFNRLFETVQEIMRKVKDTTENLTSASTELSSAMEDSACSINQISSETFDLSQGIDNTGESLNNMKQEIEMFYNNAKEISASSQDLSAFSQNIKAIAGQASKAVENSMMSFSELSKLTEESNSNINDLGQYTISIKNIADTISSIAKQTNLLALNAMIEAQRAGEAGRGFTVVAENIRNLSETTQKSVDEVKKLIESVVCRIEQVIRIEKNIKPVLENNNKNFQSVNDSLNEIFGKINEIAVMASKISGSNEKQVEGTGKIVEFSNSINAHFETQVKIAQNTNAAVQEVNATTEEAAAKSQQLSVMAEELNELIKNFKI